MLLPRTHKGRKKHKGLWFLFILLIPAVCNSYDLNQVRIETLKNGLTVMILEDHLQPLVSTQVLYKVGARNECVGSTGLAHFVEHMSFRATKNFPDTQEAIYKVGGEWHGYTWIDETTYFETVPVQHLDDALRLQADRMGNVVNRKEEVEAERGAVLTELHGYENDPSSVLFDNVLAMSFLEHPYRYNTIGWTSDVEKITHADLVSFYQHYYQPSNAVLAVAGDVETETVLLRINELFGDISSTPVDSQPRTVEPSQNGERRITLQGTSPFHYYQITYRAPGARDPDFPAFLMLQAILSGGTGVNFRQSGFSESVQAGTRLHGIGSSITTFFTPTADPYVFNIAGRANTDPAAIEEEIEKRIASVRNGDASPQEIESARKKLLSELIFDIETTEDAAHQMAYFQGIGAFAVLKKLPESLKAVSAENVKATAQKYLQPWQKTVGWCLGRARTVSGSSSPGQRNVAAWKKTDPAPSRAAISPSPRVVKLKNGIPVIVQRLPRTPAAYLRILLPTNNIEGDADFTADEPVWRYTSVQWRFLVGELPSILSKAKTVVESEWKEPVADPANMEDPEFRLAKALEEILGVTPTAGKTQPALITLVGDVDVNSSIELIRKAFEKSKKALPPSAITLQVKEKSKTIAIPGKAQSQVGYAVPVPPPSSPDSYAFRALLYVMTHGYGGRLGKELINRRGLIYYIDSRYVSDGNSSWISIRFGVNPDQLEETQREFQRLLEDLRQNPPTEMELSEAKEHLIGRRISAAQSNEEMTAFYAKEWIEQGKWTAQSEFEKRIHAVTLNQIQRILPAFLAGATVIVDTK